MTTRITDTNYLRFEESAAWGEYPEQVTITTKPSGIKLGEMIWFRAHKRYVFVPGDRTLSACYLRDIEAKLTALTAARKLSSLEAHHALNHI